MPLEHSASKEALRHNLHTLYGEVGKSPHVQSRRQALAIALETQRRGRAMGGVAPGMMPMLPPKMGATGVAGMAPGLPMPSGLLNKTPFKSLGAAPQSWMPKVSPTVAPAGMPRMMSEGGALNRQSGGLNMARGPALRAPWEERSAARNLMRGPILSSVPGRTDAHSGHVPSGSYVIPADIVSGRGQGNTLAGANVLQRMFKMGPYAGLVSPIRRGPGPPRPPRSMGMMHSGGGKGGTDRVGEPVPVNLAGGEVVVPPENLMDTVHPNLNEAHRIMDSWVLQERKKLRDELGKLPGPAKD